MNVLHVITGMQRAAGTSVFCAEVAAGLVKAGYDITMAVTDPAQKSTYPLSPSIRLVSIRSVVYARTNSNNYDVVHIHALWSPILHKVSKWAHRNKIPVVWSPHGMLTPWAMNNKKWKKALGWWLYQKWDLKKAQLIHATATSEVEDVRRLGLTTKVLIVPLGVDVINDFRLEQEARNLKVLLFVSRVQRKKGLLNLARAWAMLPKELRAGWCVRIVGPDQEGHTAEIRAECKRFNIAGDWTFTGPKYGEDLRREYACADLFVLPTFSENFGSVVVEALSHRVPVITTKGTPWSELAEYQCGWWIDIGPEPLATALKHAMSLDDALRRKMGERGRKLVEDKYTWDAVVKAMRKGYESVITER